MLNEKVKVMTAIENGEKKADVCREFDLKNSTVQTIWSNREKILRAFKNVAYDARDYGSLNSQISMKLC